MFSFDDQNVQKPTKRRDNKKSQKKISGPKPKNPRYDRNEKHKIDPLDYIFDEEDEEVFDFE